MDPRSYLPKASNSSWDARRVWSQVTTLEPILHLAFRHLAVGGLVAFSVEQPREVCETFRLEAPGKRWSTTMGAVYSTTLYSCYEQLHWALIDFQINPTCLNQFLQKSLTAFRILLCENFCSTSIQIQLGTPGVTMDSLIRRSPAAWRTALPMCWTWLRLWGFRHGSCDTVRSWLMKRSAEVSLGICEDFTVAMICGYLQCDWFSWIKSMQASKLGKEYVRTKCYQTLSNPRA